VNGEASGVELFAAREPVADPVCSVCIANYNGTQLLAECLDSVFAQAAELALEVLVHDDASTDGSVEWLRERYPQVELLAARANVGFCIANNRMVAHARGRYVLLLNNDAALKPGALRALLDVAARQGSPCIATLPQYDWATGELVDRGCRLDLFYNPVPNLDVARRQVAITIGACLFLPRSLWDELGGFPEWMGSLAEDMYLCCLARLRGVPVLVAQESGYVHRQGASFGGNRVDAGRLNTTFLRRRLSERNKTAVMVVCTPTLAVWPLLTLHAAALLLEGLALALIKRDARVWREIYLPTLRYIASDFRTLRQRRRIAQGMRRASLAAYLRDVVLFPRKLSMLGRYGVPHIH
jgi:GT2 family glycosyltransferase